MAGYTHLIWDFNGTVLDDVQAGIDCVNGMLSRRRLPTIPDAAAYRELFGFPVEDYYRRLGFDFDREDYRTVLAPEWVAAYLEREPRCPANEGVRETVSAVAALGVPQILLSATETSQLRRQLDRLGLSGAFAEIRGLDNIRAEGKLGLTEAWMRERPGARPLFFGDTVHDAEVAAAVGADCVLYTGGHQSARRLAACGAPLVDRVRDILPFLAPRA